MKNDYIFTLLELGSNRFVKIDILNYNLSQYKFFLGKNCDFRDQGKNCFSIFEGEDWLLVKDGARLDLKKGNLLYMSIFLGFRNKSDVWKLAEKEFFNYTDMLARSGKLPDLQINEMPTGNWVAVVPYLVPQELKEENDEWINRFLFGVSIMAKVENIYEIR